VNYHNGLAMATALDISTRTRSSTIIQYILDHCDIYQLYHEGSPLLWLLITVVSVND